MHVCMSVCMYVCVYVCMYVYMYVSECVRIKVHVCTRTYVCTRTWMQKRACLLPNYVGWYPVFFRGLIIQNSLWLTETPKVLIVHCNYSEAKFKPSLWKRGTLFWAEFVWWGVSLEFAQNKWSKLGNTLPVFSLYSNETGRTLKTDNFSSGVRADHISLLL